MADVFVSYDRRDRELAEKVVGALTEQGLTVWWDDRITPHETWDKTIEREVDSARRVLVLWTNHSVQSDWVRTEAGAAKESTPPKLIQARFSDCKVPLAFRLLQHVDLIGWTPKKKHAGWDRLIGWLKVDDGEAAPAQTAPAPVAAATPAPVTPPAPPKPAPPVTPPPATAQPAAPQAPMGFADMGTKAAPAGTPVTPTPNALTGSAPAAGIGGGGDGPTGPSSSAPFGAPPAGGATTAPPPDNKKVLIIVAAVLGGLILLAIIWSMMSGGGGGGGNAGGAQARVMGGYLDTYQARYAAGAERMGNDEVTVLADGGRHDWSVQLEQGRSYRILGACDTSCEDVDLFLLAPNGDQLASDVLLDDYPVLAVTPNRTGLYTVRLAMANCTVDRCVSAGRVTRLP